MSYCIHTGISNLTVSLLLLLNKIGLLEYMHGTGSLKQKNKVKSCIRFHTTQNAIHVLRAYMLLRGYWNIIIFLPGNEIGSTGDLKSLFISPSCTWEDKLRYIGFLALNAGDECHNYQYFVALYY